MDLFIDAHCHPALKRYLFGYNFFKPGRPRKDNDYTNIVVTLPALQQGNVHAVIAFHHLPEKNILSEWRTVQTLNPLLRIFAKRYLEKLENDDAFGQTLDNIREFEDHVMTGQGCRIVTSYAELKQTLEKGEKAILQGLEGAHQLGRGLSPQEYAEHLLILRARGIAILTLSHFFPNDITSPVEGIPPRTKRELGVRYTPDPNIPLSNDARKIIESVWEAGILIDLTHTCPRQRSEIFDMNRAREDGKRPLIFTHVGVRALFNDQDHPEFGLMSPDDNEIRAIQECDGLIGIIFMNYWLDGSEEKFLSGKDYGYSSILATIRHIRNITGNFDHIAIGTDFDGMTDPCDDFYEPGMLADFKARLLEDKDHIGATEADIRKILGANLLRVLETGWI